MADRTDWAERDEFGSLFPGAIILPFRDQWPRIDRGVFVAPGAVVVGDVTIGPGSSVWFQTVIRGDIAPIAIGARCSVQDGTIVHVNGDAPVAIGDDVTIGHGAMIHGTTIGDRALIGIGALVLSYSTVGVGAVIAAGALVPERAMVPDGAVMVGLPARQRSQLDPEQRDRLLAIPERYAAIRGEYVAYLRSNGEGNPTKDGGS